MEYGCIGEKLTHSFSKDIHSYLADYSYELKELTRDELPLFMKAKDFKAINVTIPYKQEVIPFLDEIDEVAKKIGAVNTIVNKNGRLFGFNTDFFGLSSLIKKLDISLNNKKVLILGTGGTSKTAYAVAESMGAKEIIKVSRQSGKNVITYSEAHTAYSDAQIIINTSPMGMYPNTYNSLIDIDAFKNLEGVVDAVYNPLRSKLVLQATAKGIKAGGGLYMLVAQAVAAVEKFLGNTLEKTKVDEVFKTIYDSKQNVVLVGMPGCGKTTVGKKIAKLLDREFIDTDDEIVKNQNISIPEIFERVGESGFREIETDIINEVSKKQGVIIATGGGAVLKNDNVNMLKQNGRLYFINRSLEDIPATESRPLSSDREALKQRFLERYGIYKSVCDVKIEPKKSIVQNAKMIAEDFLK